MTWMYAVNLHIAAFHFFGQALGKAAHGKFGGVVDRLSLQSNHAKDRRGIDQGGFWAGF